VASIENVALNIEGKTQSKDDEVLGSVHNSQLIFNSSDAH
jgi:hypothetical protein